MAITTDLIPTDGEGATSIRQWRPGVTGETGGVFNKNRVRAGYDQIRAVDINEIREQLELLMGHQHEYTSSSGGGTTTCG